MSKTLNEKRLYNIALYYLERFDASAGKLKEVFMRRLYKAKINGDQISPTIMAEMARVIEKLKKQGYLNDDRYLENQVRLLQEGGKSVRFIMQKLHTAGLPENAVREAIEKADISDDVQVRKIVQKRKMGFLRGEKQADFFQKDLAALARMGFSLDVAKRALQGDD